MGFGSRDLNKWIYHVANINLHLQWNDPANLCIPRMMAQNLKNIKNTLFFLLVACLLFANFLALFGFLVAAPAGEWTLKNQENSLVLWGNQYVRLFAHRFNNNKKRYQHRTNAEPNNSEKRTRDQRPKTSKT